MESEEGKEYNTLKLSPVYHECSQLPFLGRSGIFSCSACDEWRKGPHYIGISTEAYKRRDFQAEKYQCRRRKLGLGPVRLSVKWKNVEYCSDNKENVIRKAPATLVSAHDWIVSRHVRTILNSWAIITVLDGSPGQITSSTNSYNNSFFEEEIFLCILLNAENVSHHISFLKEISFCTANKKLKSSNDSFHLGYSMILSCSKVSVLPTDFLMNWSANLSCDLFFP
jgi:hypothetical protein